MKLEIPDLNDDPTGSETWVMWSLKTWSDKLKKAQQIEETSIQDLGQRLLQSDSGSDEGFQETDTPTSAASFGRLLSNENIWDVALSEECLKLHCTNNKTWESLGW